MNRYVILYILDAGLSEENRVSYVERFKKIIESSGEIENVDEWGVRKLAYPINKKNEGYYVLMHFKSTPEVIQELTRVFRISEDVMRFLIVNQDK